MLKLSAQPAGLRPDLARYAQLLGYPRGRPLGGQAAVLAAQASDWYRANGRPWICARELPAAAVRSLQAVAAPVRQRVCPFAVDHADGSVVVAAMSAGEELETETARLWRHGHVDQYFFLQRYGAALVEELLAWLFAELNGSASARQLQALPPYSPGYPGWELAQQRVLFQELAGAEPLPGRLRVLDTGALWPTCSQLALFPFAPLTAGAQKPAKLIPCRSCALPACEYRRSAET